MNNKSAIYLSVLIPVYNYDCSILVEKITAQLSSIVDYKSEIILGNDASTAHYPNLFKELEQRGLCRVVSVEKNIGAGAMRNILAQEAKGDLLLYIDSDTLPLKDDFIKRYITASTEDTVILGGFVYPTTPPSNDRILRYKYGCQVEMQDAQKRNKHPYERFIAMSFLVPRKIKLQTPFDETGMGYEDTLFGYHLQEMGITIEHIDNPVLHDLKESSEQFLATTLRYVENLYRVRYSLKGKGVKLLNLFFLMQKLGLLRIVASFYKSHKWRQKIEQQLCSLTPSLQLFSLYKLIFLCYIAQKNK